MKKIIFFVLLSYSITAIAQISLEHKYDSASTQGIFTPNGTVSSQLMIVKFEFSGERYVNINRAGKNICIYDLNHSLIKKISLASYPMNNNGTVGDILYLSEQLFNTDAAIEFMYLYSVGNSYKTNIYNDDGILIFSDTLAPVIKVNYPLQQLPIYNTTQGTKMILSCYKNGQAWVYSLPGTLTVNIAEVNDELLNQSNLKISNPYPNPSVNSTRIDYNLPDGVNQSEIVFYDLQGNEIKRFKVDRTFNTLLISTSDIAAGTYYYQLQTSAEYSGGKKMVVIK